VVGDYFQFPTTLQHGFLLSGGIFITLDFPGASQSAALGINDSGQVVGGYFSDVIHGFLLSGGIFSLDFPGAIRTDPTGINNSGQVVGRYQSADGAQHSFLLSGGVFSTFEFPGAVTTSANGINDSGQIVGSYADAEGGQHGYIATPIPTSVPEPSTLGLTLGMLGFIAAGSWRRRRHSSSQ
jgi:probable HAF family extracellular repeat protein